MIEPTQIVAKHIFKHTYSENVNTFTFKYLNYHGIIIYIEFN